MQGRSLPSSSAAINSSSRPHRDAARRALSFTARAVNGQQVIIVLSQVVRCYLFVTALEERTAELHGKHPRGRVHKAWRERAPFTASADFAAQLLSASASVSPLSALAPGSVRGSSPASQISKKEKKTKQMHFLYVFVFFCG